MSSTEVVVGRIGKPHGVRGELSVELRTDEPDRRFGHGAVLATQTPHGGPPHSEGRPEHLTVAGTRWHQSRLLVTFVEVRDRNQAEALRGLLLAAAVDGSETPDDPEEFYDHQLVGLSVLTTDGVEVGRLTEVLHTSAQDLLSITAHDGREILVPFVAQLVPTVDVPAGRLLVADRPGLLNADVQDQEGA
ncbi:MAG TPA: ribosome maturation factor RimM [Nocardioidaceae bacterium]|nr:ribosome maturation factor RimM [Nocardioidaceae bacterium]